MKIRLLLIQFLSTFLHIFRPLCLIAEKVQPGDIVSITASFQGDEIYVPKVVYNSKHREYLPGYSKNRDKNFGRHLSTDFLSKGTLLLFSLPIQTAKGESTVFSLKVLAKVRRLYGETMNAGNVKPYRY